MPHTLRISLFAFFTISTVSAFAQPAAFDRSMAPQIQFNTGLPVTSHFQTQNRSSRLLAQARYRHDGEAEGMALVDSTRYQYSADRGGDPAAALRFDESLSWKAGDAVAAPAQRSMQSFGADGAITGYRTQRWDAATNAWTDQYRFAIVNGNGFRMGDTSWSWKSGEARWVPAAYAAYSRNAAGQPTEIVRFEWNSGRRGFDSSARILYSYDRSGNLVEQTARYGKGNLHPASRTTYAYNSHNAATGIISESWDSVAVAWTPASAYAFQLNGVNDRVAQTNLYWNAARGAWDSTVRYSYTYDVRRNAIAMVSQAVATGGEKWRNIDRCMYTYNAEGQQTGMERFAWSAASSSWGPKPAEQRRYHYEAVATGVGGARRAVKLNVWPVPARKTLHMDVQALQAAAYTGVITDLQGRTITTWQRPVAPAATDQIGVDELPAGSYLLRLQSVNGEACQARFTVVK